MKVQILILAILLAMAQALFPTENHQKIWYQYKQGCYKGNCWAYCSGAKSWCYTKKCVWKGCEGRISCSGSKYGDDSCPYYENDNYDDNCDSGCFWF